MTTSPDSVTYEGPGYGVLGPFPALLVNVQDFGADPTGNDDSTLAIQDALDAAGQSDNGGEVVVPPGVYKITATLYAKSNTIFSGSGTLKASPVGEWTGARYRGFSNFNWDAPAITDENIVIRGVTFDWDDLGSQGGTAHVIYIKRARNITITGVTVRGGASCVALLGCDNTLEQGNSYFDSENCLSDHWDNPRNAAVIGCYLEAGALRSISQMVNFNPEPSDLIGTGHVASGFIMTGCTVVSHEASSTQSQIEPLATGNYVERVNVTGNTWVNSYVVARGDVRGATFANNDFSGFLGTNAVIYCTDRFGVNPSALLVSNNIIRGALTTAPAEAVIVAQSVSALVQGNLIMGTGYTTSAITTVGAGGQILANYVEGTPVVGRLQGGARVINGTSSYWGWTDTNGSSPRMFLQSDDNWIWRSTGVGGTDRSVMSLQALSDTSEARWSVPNFFNNYTRQAVATVAAAGTTIGTATVLTANINNVSTATGGVADGVSLNPVDGQEQVVINTTAATIKVYPNNNGTAQIDGGGAGVPTTILAGKSKTFVRVAASNFRTTAAT